jgi:rubrerythrin
MAQKRMIDFLRLAETFHLNLSNDCKQHVDDTVREDVRMLLGYIEHHEKALAESLEEYERDASKPVLDAWFKVSPNVEFAEAVEDFAINTETAPDDILKQVQQMDEALVAMYNVLLDQAVSDELNDVLKSLIEQELSEEVKLLRSLSEN